MSFAIVMLVLGMSTVLWVFNAVYTYYQQRVFGALALPIIVLCLTIALWAILHSVEVAVASLSLKIAAYHAKYLVIITLPVSWVWFAASSANMAAWLTRRRLLLIAVIPAITALLIVTNPWHHLLWSALVPYQMGEVVVIEKVRGVLGWVFIPYAYGLLIFSEVKMLHFVFGPRRIYHRPYMLVLLLVMLPVMTSPILSLGLLPMDVTPYTLVISGLGVAWSLFSYRMVDLVPLARNIVTESMADGMLVIDASGNIFSINSTAKAILGVERSELIGQPYLAVLHDLMLAPVKEDGSSPPATSQIQRLVNGELRYLELRVSYLRAETDKIVGRVVIIRDITRRKENEVRLKAALDAEKELNALRARFVSIVSHEFRTPMSIIQTATEMMQLYRDRMDAKALDDKFNTVVSQIALMNTLIDDVLSLDRLQTGTLRYRPQMLPAVETIRDLIDEMRQDKFTASRIEFDPPALGVELALDKKLIRLVIRNLVGNALKYSPDGQPVTVTMCVEDDMLQLCIVDRGIGIPEEDQARLFDPFYRAANVGDVPGSGLGLMIVKQVVDLHSGKIHFTSSSSGGTTFFVLLPLNASAQVEATDC